jgi:beta-lactamase regulating signal transducer with metallopeptidase domain
MLHEAFYWVSNMSILATVFGILLYLLRLVKGFPKFARYLLWAVVFIRLLCPFGISSEFSLLSMISKAFPDTVVKTVPMEDRQVDEEGTSPLIPELSLSNTIQQADSYHPVTYKTDILEEFFDIASLIWVLIAAAALIAMTVLYFITKAELKRAVHLKNHVYQGGMVDTPTVYGIIRPRIVVPLGIEKEQMKYILAHENIHIRRHDNIWRMLAILAACIHWFNPFSWLFLKCFLGDCELACDEAAVKKMDAEERKKYAHALLTCASKNSTAFSSAFGSSKVKIRIENVLSFKKLTLFSTICFTCMAIITAFLLLTNAAR